ncbi:MAG TPA: 3-carboxy-cis,cis-muconate cycloisomerase [Mycobacteriales bacterium]|jgi:3-carboxy-cis,cis-muconate cycloisomerase|nr:3-carboxy-cis,cis-muconate cycloisomerase [Mycobacteriales bacterium]
MKPSSSRFSSALTGPLFAAAAVDAAIDDEAFLRAMVDAEIALVSAAAEVGVVPSEAAAVIAAACESLEIDIDALGHDAEAAGSPVVPLVRLISDAVGDDAKPWVHYGATSQDIIDTALMLISKRSGAVVVAALEAAADTCASLAAEHRDTAMAARTLGQQAAPTTFGRKAAGWLVGLDEAADRLAAVCEHRLAAQLGGPVGTLAAFGADGDAVGSAYAAHLGLQSAPLPWHTDRQRVLDLAAALGEAAATAAKIATDIVLMAQTEVGEVGLAAAGGSSSMPHKHNPVDAILVIAGAARAPGLVATLFAAATPEHERGTGAWHSEWEPWRELLSVAGGVCSRTATMLGGLQVNSVRMQGNLDATGGLLMAESVAVRLAATIGRSTAHDVVGRCVKTAATSAQSFAEVLASDPDVTAGLDSAALAAALDPAAWLGIATSQVDRAVAAHRDRRRRSP